MEKIMNKEIGIVGATGLVGSLLLDILVKRFIKSSTIHAFASDESAGTELVCRNKKFIVKKMTEDDLEKCHVLFFASSEAISKKWIPIMADRGVLCIDKSSAFRMDPRVSLVIPEIHFPNVNDLKDFPVISSPNCCTIPLALSLFPIHQKYGIKNIIVSTYQSVSGAGKSGIEALRSELLEIDSETPFPKKIAYNVFPFVSHFVEDGHTDEEFKIKEELKKILYTAVPEFQFSIDATSVRVPTFVGHGESVTLGLHKPAQKSDIVQCLSQYEGIQYEDFPIFSTPLECEGKDDVFVSRLRPAENFDSGYSYWLVCDNLRKGASLNAVQIFLKSIEVGFFSP
jgi:aspartate-semialdehyde dehydrogenase